MDRLGEQQSRFEIKSNITQKPFESFIMQKLFIDWCHINDSLEPQIISKDEWLEKNKKGILEKRKDGKSNLYIYDDMSVVEIVKVVEAINPGTNKISELGKSFQDSGIYIAQRLGKMPLGQSIASDLATEFYSFGKSLVDGKKLETPVNIKDIASHKLNPSEIDAVEHFLGGGQKKLNQFFEVSEKIFNSKKHGAFIKNIENKINQTIEPLNNDLPKTELFSAVSKRGLDMLQKLMPIDNMREDMKNKDIISYWKNGETLLYKALQINKQRKDLEKIKKTGDLYDISKKENEIANNIQIAISSYPYDEDIYDPSQIVVKRKINCIGASALGVSLMKMAGLNCLVGEVPEHSILLLVKSDGNIEWRDMRYAYQNDNLSNDMITGNKKDNTPITVADIFAFSKNPKSEGLTFDITDKIRDKLFWVKETERPYVTVFAPELGIQDQILNTLANVIEARAESEENLFKKTLLCEEIIEVYRLTLASGQERAEPHNGLGCILRSLGSYEEDPEKRIDYFNQSIEEFNKAIDINPQLAHLHHGLGFTFFYIACNETDPNIKKVYLDKAIHSLTQALAIDSDFAASYNGFGGVYFEYGKSETDPEKKKNYYLQAAENHLKAVSLAPKECKISYKGLGDTYQELALLEPDMTKKLEYYNKLNEAYDKFNV